MWKKANETIEIICEVPHVIDYCYLNTPDGTEHDIEPWRFAKTKYLGICRFIVEPVTGLYSCGVNDVNGGEDIQTYYQVEVFKVPAKVMTTVVVANANFSPRLLVKSMFNHSIEYCRFVNPAGEVHGVSEKFKQNGKYSYYGNGLISGECGLEIKKVTDAELGTWTCIFSLADQEFQLGFTVESPGFTVAYVAIPLIAFTVIFAVLIGMFILRKQQRERRAQYQASIGTMRELDLSQSSHES